MLPVRCFTCNSIVGDLWYRFVEAKRECATGKEALDRLGLKHMCCRRMLLGHQTVIDDLLMYSNVNHVLDECNTTFDCGNDNPRTVSCD